MTSAAGCVCSFRARENRAAGGAYCQLGRVTDPSDLDQFSPCHANLKYKRPISFANKLELSRFLLWPAASPLEQTPAHLRIVPLHLQTGRQP